MDTSELLNIKVGAVMTTNVAAVFENDNMELVADIINSSNIHHIPVIDEDGHLKGIISKLDVVLLQDWATSLQLPSAIKRNSQVLKSQCAKDRMTVRMAKVHPDDTLETCADIFKENLFRCLPVVDRGKLVGLITTFDLMRIAYSKAPKLNRQIAQ